MNAPTPIKIHHGDTEDTEEEFLLRVLRVLRVSVVIFFERYFFAFIAARNSAVSFSTSSGRP